MQENKQIPLTVEAYLAACPEADQIALQKIRAAIRKAVPGGEETISYGMPTVKCQGVVMHFAVFTKHYSIFIRPGFKKEFARELEAYSQTKSAVHFPKGNTIPVSLISRMAAYIAGQNDMAARKKKVSSNRGVKPTKFTR